MNIEQEKTHKFTIGEGNGIWTDDEGPHYCFPDVFYRAKPGDAAGKFEIGDFVVMCQPSFKKRFGKFVITNIETGDFGGAGLKYKLTVHPYETPYEIDNARGLAPKAETFKKKSTMKQPTYTMQRIALADCKPHADAEAYSASSEDRAALSNSINESGLLSPIAVIPGEDGGEGADATNGGKDSKRTTARKTWYVIDGIGRLNALMAAGVTETDAQVFDLGDLSVAEFVVCKNAMMRKVTTGTRVMAYLKCHEREVLAAADPEKYGSRKTSKWRNKVAAVSRETASNRGWSAKDIAERIGVSKNDVLAGIDLLKATAESGEDGEGAAAQDGPHYEQMDLFETAEAVLRGETPIRRWKAAAGGKVSKVGGKAAADYEAIGMRTMASLAALFANWQAVPMEGRAPIIQRFYDAFSMIPDDFMTVVEQGLGLKDGWNSKAPRPDWKGVGKAAKKRK